MDLTLREVKPLIKYIISNNDEIEKRGQPRVSINLTSEAGYGKSAIVEEIANELGANYVKLNLAQITETGDLAGYPICLHYACKDDGSDCKWIPPELIDGYIKAGYQLTGETQMSYALPKWYRDIDPTKPTILNLDDLSRALPNIIQAVYELVYKQEFWSFKLPPQTTIILTTNPSNGDYNVNDEDEAARSRRVNFTIKWDIESWAQWAEANHLDNRTINFMLAYHHELMDDYGTHTHVMNARSYTMFANIIAGIPNWQNANNLAMILQIASGCFNDKDNVVGTLFTSFIANKLDKLISPEDLLLGDWDKVYDKAKKCVYDENGQYKPSVGAILQTRLLNYCLYYFSQKGAKTETIVNRLISFIDAEKDVTIFSEDMLYNLIKTLRSLYPTRMNTAILRPEIRSKVIF